MIHDLFAFLFWLAVGLIFYHLAGYPLLLALLNRIVKNPVRRADYTPRTSVIIPAYNEAGVIEEKVFSVLSCDYPSDALEVIVVDDGSTDGTAEQVSSMRDLGVILETGAPRGGKMAALARGAARATGEYLLISDADVILKPGALRSLMANFADPRVGCVSGHRVHLGANAIEAHENAYLRYESWIKRQESRLGSTPAVGGTLIGVPRALFCLPSGGVINDDFQMALNAARAGKRVIFEHGAVGIDKGGSASMQNDYDRKSRVAAGRWQLTGQVLALAFRSPGFVFCFFSHKLLRLFIFPLMIAALAASLGAVLFPLATGASGPGLLRLSPPWAAAALISQAAFYLLAGIGALLERSGRRIKPLSFLYFFVNAQFASLGGVVRHSTGRQSMLWRKAAH